MTELIPTIADSQLFQAALAAHLDAIAQADRLSEDDPAYELATAGEAATHRALIAAIDAYALKFALALQRLPSPQEATENGA